MEAQQPKLRFPGFEGDWESKLFKEIYSFRSTNSLSRDKLNYEKGIVRNIHYGDIHSKFNSLFKIEKELVPYINDDISLEKIPSDNFLKEKDLVIADASEDYEDIGKCLEIIDLNEEDVLAGLHTFIARPDLHDMALGFGNYLMKSDYSKIQIKTIAQGTKVLSISATRLSEIKVNIPSLEEQTRIANFLTSVDEKANFLKEKKALLEEYKKGMMQQIFSQEIRFKDANGEDFEDWEQKILKDFMDERNTQLPKNDKYPLMSFVANKGVTHKGDRYNREFLVNDEGNKKYKQTEFGDFIYSSNNLETGSIGLNNYGSASISPVYSIFRINEMCDYKFISNFFSRKEFISKMTKFRQGVMYGQWRIHEKDFLQIKESFPCLMEQTKIATFLSAIDQKIELVATQIEDTQVYKKGLLQQLFV